MAQEGVMELMQKPEIKKAMQTMMLNYFQQQKENTLKRYKMLNRHVKKGQVLFVGSSLMELFPINEMQHTLDIDNL